MVGSIDSWVGIAGALVGGLAGMIGFVYWLRYTLSRIESRQTEIMQCIDSAVQKPSNTQRDTLRVLNQIAEGLTEGVKENREAHQKFLEMFVRQTAIAEAKEKERFK